MFEICDVFFFLCESCLEALNMIQRVFIWNRGRFLFSGSSFLDSGVLWLSKLKRPVLFGRICEFWMMLTLALLMLKSRDARSPFPRDSDSFLS